MAFFTKQELLAEAKNFSSINILVQEGILATLKRSTAARFDYFISHSAADKQLIKGLVLYLTRKGKKVYVDWIVDPQLDRQNVTATTASVLKTRMQQSDILLYAISNNAALSKWMPWELGFFDAAKGQRLVKILPITDNASDAFQDQEFTRLYDKIGKGDI